MALPRFVSLRHAAEALDVSVRTIERLIERGELTSYRVGGRRTLRVEADEILGLLEPDDQVIPTSC